MLSRAEWHVDVIVGGLEAHLIAYLQTSDLVCVVRRYVVAA